MTRLNIPANTLQELRHCRRGIEKEGLRVTREGLLSDAPHPQALGSALTHPSITTDYSEALLEFVTKAHASIDGALTELRNLHRFTAQVLDKQGEFILANSMPCLMIEDHEIPIAEYGSSNLGQMKTVYRRGLGHRYGRTMQTIAGIHYNWSLSESFWHAMAEEAGEPTREFKDTTLMKAVRNVYRSNAIITYLTGCSPAVCPSFLRGAEATGLATLNGGTLYLPEGTSLRLSDIGYSNDNSQRGLVRLDSIASYTADLLKATQTPNAAFEKIGIINNGEYQQLNAHILQIENEYYAPVRPKQIARGMVRVANALRDDGIGYLELRIVDIDPFADIGISEETCHLLEAYLLSCVLRAEPNQCDVVNNPDYWAISRAVVEHGRNPETVVKLSDRSIVLSEWLHEEINHIAEAAVLLDSANDTTAFSDAVNARKTSLSNPKDLPSQRAMDAIAENQSFFRFAFHSSERYHNELIKDALSQNELQQFNALAADSMKQQQLLEADTELSFKAYLDRYFHS